MQREEAMLTLEEFNTRVIKPTILRSIKDGRLDAAILNDDYCFVIIMSDPDMRMALLSRVEECLK